MNPDNVNKTKKPFGWAVIGTGRIADTVMREITATGRHRVVAVYSRTGSRARKFAEKYGAQYCPTVKDALSCAETEGVYIATPHSVHYKYILECVERGVPVLCEKAFTVNLAQAIVAIERAENKNVYLAEAMWTRFNPVVRQICVWVRCGEIGEIKSIRANFCLPLSIAKPFVSDRVYKAEYAGGALLDLGVYPVAYAHMLLGIPARVQCRARLKDGVDYHDEIILSYDNAECRLCCSFDKLKTYKAEITGTKGKIVSPMFYKPERATLINENGRKTVKCKRGYVYEFDGVAEDIRAGIKENRFISHRDTLEIMDILDQCRRQNSFSYPDNIEKL